MLVLGVARLEAERHKLALKEYVDADTPIGLLGYVDRAPVAWCSIAPRSTFRKGLAVVLPEDKREIIWSLSCFFITGAKEYCALF